jgi:hypothetical protein
MGMTLNLGGEQFRLLVLSRFAQGALEGERAAGLRKELVEALRNLAASDLTALARMSDPEIVVTNDPVTLARGLRNLDYVRERTRDIEFFIRHGATLALLVALFRLNPAEAREHRTRLGVTAGRRPRMPSAKQREAICARWHALRSGRESAVPTVEDYRSLHADFPGLSLATLDAVINEFIR